MQFQDVTVGFIGCGEIAQSIIKGILKSGILHPNQLKASTSSSKTSYKATNLGISYATNEEIKNSCNVIILCVRPSDIISMLKSIPSSTIIISTAAGITIESMEYVLKTDDARKPLNVFRTMPSVAAYMCSSFTGFSYNKDHVSSWGLQVSKWIFEAVGTVQVVDEHLIGNVIASSGSSICVFIYLVDALTRAVTTEGYPDHVAVNACTSTMLNAAKLLMENNYDTQKLIQSIKVPKGTTEAGLNVLDEGGFNDLIDKCVKAMITRNDEISKLT